VREPPTPQFCLIPLRHSTASRTVPKSRRTSVECGTRPKPSLSFQMPTRSGTIGKCIAAQGLPSHKGGGKQGEDISDVNGQIGKHRFHWSRTQSITEVCFTNTLHSIWDLSSSFRTTSWNKQRRCPDAIRRIPHPHAFLTSLPSFRVRRLMIPQC
jgi:hypothetical protein